MEYCAAGKIPAENDNGGYTVKKGYKVTFYKKDGSTVIDPVLPIEYLHKVTSPNAVPAEEGLHFKEWIDQATDSAFDFDTLVNKDYKLQAKYYATVTFVDEDGTSVLKEATNYDEGTAGSSIAKPADPSKAADAQYTYTFA